MDAGGLGRLGADGFRPGESHPAGRAADLRAGGPGGAALSLVEDVGARRYGDPAPPAAEWAVRRGELTRSYLGAAVDALVAVYS